MTKPLLLAAVVLSASAAIFAGQPPATQSELARATQGMNRHAIAEYVFRTYQCQTCHVATAAGGTGFTTRGEDARKRFVGCVRLLTAVAGAAASASAPTAEQQRANESFKEFGCTLCHASESGAMGYTSVGRALGSLHLGCVEIRQEVSKEGVR